ncbi:MAG: mechanosensitive ion channel family protein [Chloroflexi bacterium]|nr:MAG: mechanosensitive ion channel family protein [Chloroflexota bacterium]
MDIQQILDYFKLPEKSSSILIETVIIIGLLWLIRTAAVYVINHRIKDVRARYTWRKTFTYAAITLGVFLVGRLWLTGIQSLATYLGLLSAGLAIALQGPLSNLVGWFFILWRRPFEVGDRVQVGPHTGDVIDVRFFQFTVLELGNWVASDQSTGRVLHIPNGTVFSETVANYNRGFEYIWNEIPVLVTFESNWEQAKTLLQEIANRHAAHLSEDAARRVRQAAQRFAIIYTKLTPIVYTRVEASGVLLTIRYLAEPRLRRNSEHAIWEDILREFAHHPDIEFAYPTQRTYHRWLDDEKKPLNLAVVSAHETPNLN